jgi:NAD(P)-dependent dehydrogenase (short-subunit alcohol dehydrogenase family)
MRRGADVAVHCFSSESGAHDAARQGEALGVRTAVIRADLTDAAAASRLAERARDALGGLDILVNNAAIMERREWLEVSDRDWDRVMNLNLRGAFFAAQGAARVMAERGGTIVNIADLAAFQRWKRYPVHAISKAGLVAMTEVLAKALAPHIRVNAVAPGAILPPQDWTTAAVEKLAAATPLKRLGSADDVVNAVVFLIESDYLTGETIVVDGGRRLA